MRNRARTAALALLPALAALLVSLVVLSVVLALIGVDPLTALRAIFDFGRTPRARSNQTRAWISQTVPLFLAGLAVSVAFRMNLFNIGVEGQYRMAALVAAAAGAAVTLPAPLHVTFILTVAMLTGAAYAAVPAVLKVTRGINEVITTIMLNSIAVALAAYLLREFFRDPDLPANTNPSTSKIPESGRVPGLDGLLELFGMQSPSRPVNGFLLIALAVGIVAAVVLRSSRFGFALRVSGLNLNAARAGGIPANRMIIQAMLLSGALAGLIGMPQVLGEHYSYRTEFTAGFGFSGVAVALLGRNSPAGIAAAALLFGFLDRAAPSLQRAEIPPSVVTIAQGVIVLAVVVVDQVGRTRLRKAEESRAAGTGTDTGTDNTDPTGPDRTPDVPEAAPVPAVHAEIPGGAPPGSTGTAEKEATA
jgi:general nucleoside transport system permease protein